MGLCPATHGFTVWGTLSDNLSFVICDTLMLMPSHNVVVRTKDNVSEVLPSVSERGGARGVTAARAGRRSRISTDLNLEGPEGLVRAGGHTFDATGYLSVGL